MNSKKLGFSTSAIHSENLCFEWPGNPVVCGISLSSTFKQDTPGKPKKYDYSRSSNPTRESLENSLAVLEKANHALAFSSGLAAESCVLHLLKSADEIVCMDDVYGGTNRLFNRVFNSFGITTKMVDLCNLSLLEATISDATKVVWVETPTNPTLKVVDIAGVRDVIKKAQKDILLVVDNTFMTPYYQNPLILGADIVIHSLTKYINGHSDVVMGCLMVNDTNLYKRLCFYQNAVGAVPSPFDCFLVLRGIKTLSIRMDRHQSSTFAVANHFLTHPQVQQVIYPGLPTHPQYEICKRQASGFSGMMSMVLKGDVATTTKFLENLQIFSVAESLGGFESLCELPSIMTHASVPENQRAVLGISDTLVRFSIGLEDPQDLINDIEQALARSLPN